MPGNALLGNASTTISTTSTSSPKVGVIIGIIVGGIITLAIVLFLVTYFVCCQRSKAPMPHPAKTKALDTQGMK